jgi:hypothetical protein
VIPDYLLVSNGLFLAYTLCMFIPAIDVLICRHMRLMQTRNKTAP